MIGANTISETTTFHSVFKISGMNTLGSRIAHYRKLANLSQGKLAKACGWASQSRIGNYELDSREPSLDDIALIAKALHIPPERLLTGGSNENVTETNQPYREAKEYPLISWVAAGAWQEACDNFHPGDADDWLSSDKDAGACGYWLEVKGPSMLNTFTPGMRILVKPEDFDLVSGKFYIARLESTGETTFKQYLRDGGSSYLQPLNNAFPMIPITDDVSIIGMVIDAKLPASLF